MFQNLFNTITMRVAFIVIALFKSSGVICWHSTTILWSATDVVRATG